MTASPAGSTVQQPPQEEATVHQAAQGLLLLRRQGPAESEAVFVIAQERRAAVDGPEGGVITGFAGSCCAGGHCC